MYVDGSTKWPKEITSLLTREKVHGVKICFQRQTENAG